MSHRQALSRVLPGALETLPGTLELLPSHPTPRQRPARAPSLLTQPFPRLSLPSHPPPRPGLPRTRRAVGTAPPHLPVRAPPPVLSAQARWREKAARAGWGARPALHSPARTYPPPPSRTPRDRTRTRTRTRAAAPLARPPLRCALSSSRRHLSPAPQPRSRPRSPAATPLPPSSWAAARMAECAQSSSAWPLPFGQSTLTSPSPGPIVSGVGLPPQHPTNPPATFSH